MTTDAMLHLALPCACIHAAPQQTCTPGQHTEQQTNKHTCT